jgi:hypothetical protein
MDLVKNDVIKFFSENNESLPDELDIVKETSITIGQAFM